MNTSKIILLTCLAAFISCASKSTDSSAKSERMTALIDKTPVFNEDSAYIYIKNQTDFGPRVPNSSAHKACGDYLISELNRLGGELFVQEMTLTAYNKTKLNCRNIITSFNPANSQRILLFAHWDSRPYADMEQEQANKMKPIIGADDGASGVGVLLEIARQISLSPIQSVGIDIIFFDAEDYGTPDFDMTHYQPDTWCLGSQFWARTPHKPNYTAKFGILLDMVGAQNATFLREYTSEAKAPHIIDKIWNTARGLGYGKYFINEKGGSITDDHVYVNSGRGVPSIDIINYDYNHSHGFADHWHTHKDNLDIISKETLKAVGQTLLEVIYNQ